MEEISCIENTIGQERKVMKEKIAAHEKQVSTVFCYESSIGPFFSYLNISFVSRIEASFPTSYSDSASFPTS